MKLLPSTKRKKESPDYSIISFNVKRQWKRVYKVLRKTKGHTKNILSG